MLQEKQLKKRFFFKCFDIREQLRCEVVESGKGDSFVNQHRAYKKWIFLSETVLEHGMQNATGVTYM